MPENPTIQEQLLAENEDLRARLDEAEETLRAIRSGEVDALVVRGAGGAQIFTLKGADHAYRVLVEEMNEGALTLTAEGLILYANRRFAEMLKTPLETVIGSVIHTWIAPADQGILRALLGRDDAQTRHEEVTLLAGDATAVSVYLSINRLQTEEMPEPICLVVTDLTMQKRAEEIAASEKLARDLLLASNQSSTVLLSVIEDQKRAERALCAEKEFARTLLDNIVDGVVACDAEGTLVLFNQTAREWHGMDALTIPSGEWSGHYDLCGPDATTPLPTEAIPLIRAFHGETVRDAEISIVAKGQPPRHILSAGSPFYDDRHNILGAVVVMHDITERRRAVKKIRELNAGLEQRVRDRTARLTAANEDLDAFCHTVSHDLRAPLRHIDGYVELLVARCGDGLTDKGRHYLDIVAASAREMGVLIDELLQFSRTGRAEMHRESVDMNRALQEAMTPLKESHAGRTIEWVVGDLPPVSGDYALFRQVWANLLGNAVKYTRPREAARIEVSAREEGGETVFAVRDNGVGFDMHHAGKLFGIFQRLHSLAEFEGTGIGLATVQRIVKCHDGRVWAEAELDRGAAFYFTVPNPKEAIHA